MARSCDEQDTGCSPMVIYWSIWWDLMVIYRIYPPNLPMILEIAIFRCYVNLPQGQKVLQYIYIYTMYLFVHLFIYAFIYLWVHIFWWNCFCFCLCFFPGRGTFPCYFASPPSGALDRTQRMFDTQAARKMHCASVFPWCSLIYPKCSSIVP